MHDRRTAPDSPLVGRRTALRTGLLAAAGLGGLAACGSGGDRAAAAAATPSGAPTGTEHTATRVTVSPGLPYEEVVSRYEKTVPPLPAAQLAAAVQSKPFKDVKALLAKASPVSMFIFYTLNVTPFMTKAGHQAKCKTYLMGNPLIAETMYGHNAGVMLYAPLRTAIFTDDTGAAHLTIDRPSDLFGSFNDAHIAATGHTLDATLVKLLKHLKFPVPAELQA
jgi:uncharacterized protein DUF302